MKTSTIISRLVVAALVLATIAVNFGGITQSSSVNAVNALPSVLQLKPEQYGPAAADNQNLEVEVITLTANGFDPPLITRSRGPFILALHNMSGERELDFRIYRAQGQQLQQLRISAGRRANHQRLDLPPGDYVVAEANHPEWTCALTITR